MTKRSWVWRAAWSAAWERRRPASSSGWPDGTPSLTPAQIAKRCGDEADAAERAYVEAYGPIVDATVDEAPAPVPALVDDGDDGPFPDDNDEIPY